LGEPADPDVIGFVDIPCGSHTETLLPDLENDRLLVHSNSSANTTFGGNVPPDSPPTCRGIDIIEVPLDDPTSASYLRFEPTGHEDDPPENLHSCHDTGVILGETNLVACAGQTSATGGNGVTVFSVDPAMGGSKEDPMFLYHKTTGGVSLGHSASFTWDGKYIIVGHEPGGGSGANCEATDNPRTRRSGSSSAATGRATGTTAGSASPTSRAGSSSGTSATRPWPAAGSSTTSIRRRRSSTSTETSRSGDWWIQGPPKGGLPRS
jgi:hypothetical protein